MRGGYTECNRVARCSFDIGDQAESCAQLFYIKTFVIDNENNNI
nr:MAG TPA: hypothetical protein [Caudoviricetes sp.]